MNTCKAFNHHIGAFQSIWRLNGTLNIQERSKEKFLFTFSDAGDIERAKRGGPWSLNCVLMVINDYDDFSLIENVPLNHIWILI